ncbi:MAG: glycosyltransferase family 2 protein [Erysipelotrichaceae bacterium]|nr:glycosyltransferase family 2 protein [Erysipelotrichaceae bacterium]
MNELISVIIPFYNIGQYIGKAIASVLDQTYENFELLLIDDGSTDQSGEISYDYALKDKRIRVIHQKNSGIASARNTGIDEAKGSYICWVDSDDYISRYLLEDLYHTVQSEDVPIAVCEYIQGPDRDYQFKKYEEQAEMISVQKAFEFLYEKDGHNTFITNASWGKLIRADLYDGIRYPDGKIFEDIYVTYRLIGKCDKIAFLKGIRYYYFKHPKSIMHSPFSAKRQDYLPALEERISYFSSHGLNELSEKARISYLHSLIWEFSRAKDILKDKQRTSDIITSYRKYYRDGDFNPDVSGETKEYMAAFNKNPYMLDLKEKIKRKLGK